MVDMFKDLEDVLDNPQDTIVDMGTGDKLILDFVTKSDEENVHVAIVDALSPVKVGKVVQAEGELTENVGKVRTVIRTANPASLDVIIAACQRAKETLLKKKKIEIHNIVDGDNK